MKLLIVSGPPFTCQCIACAARIEAGTGHLTRADIEGEAFKAYYCHRCAVQYPACWYVQTTDGQFLAETADPDTYALEDQMRACDHQAEIGTPEHRKRFHLKDAIFAARAAVGKWPAQSCAERLCRIGGCHLRDYHHLGDCCLHCGNDERADRYHTSTQWEQVQVSAATARYLRGTHALWSRLFDGQHVFTVRPNGEVPSPGDGGYLDIAAALTAKGMKP